MPRKPPAATNADTAHLVTIGTTPSGVPSDVVEALIADLKPLRPAHLSVMATGDSVDNAERLRAGLRLPKGKFRLVLLESHHSIDEAYSRASEEIEALLDGGFDRRRIVLNYTAGTKAMSAGAVLAAVGAGIEGLRYLLPAPKGSAGASEAVHASTPAALVARRRLDEATDFFFEQRFDKAAETAHSLDASLLPPPARERRELVEAFAVAYGAWDNFQVDTFLSEYERHEARIPAKGRLKGLRLRPRAIELLRPIARTGRECVDFPPELIVDLFNNAVRRLREHRFDDALARLYRAAELYAQAVIFKEYGLRTDRLDIRRVPPRRRAMFESLRRIDDATIKLGLRRSYELLETLGHPLGTAFRENTSFQQVLEARRRLVLAHGTVPCPPKDALDMARELSAFVEMTYPDFAKNAEAMQFPWISNRTVLAELSAGR
ncbi:MAG: TIGR02710 family CRISPR-associated CARF protein [Candidatus Sumerlaeia bacterium]|nr:TIGR02710 family CRISPR-associated CARF protein [Candidatus Sumerlaeia bacterium]